MAEGVLAKAFVAFEYCDVGLHLFFEAAAFKERRRYTLNLVASLAVADDPLSRLLGAYAKHFGKRRFAVRAGDGDDRFGQTASATELFTDKA